MVFVDRLHQSFLNGADDLEGLGQTIAGKHAAVNVVKVLVDALANLIALVGQPILEFVDDDLNLVAFPAVFLPQHRHYTRYEFTVELLGNLVVFDAIG